MTEHASSPASSPATPASAFTIRALATELEARACAEMMASNDPWVRFGRTFDDSYRIIRDPAREVYVAQDVDGGVAGFTILVMQGAFVGYIQSVAVDVRWRGHGLGSALITFAERRIFRDTPNAFICASSFNPGARRLYERLGYELVGELTDYIVRGQSEFLMRKTRGPLAEHVTSSRADARDDNV